jgi:nicotinamidase/pyrazinamidase
VAESPGARFANALNLPPATAVISKGTTPDQDAYSGFQGTDLDDRLRRAGVRRVFVGGLATDYCVVSTVRDALTRGYRTVVLADAIRAVNVQPDDGRKAEAEMGRLGAALIRIEALTR